MHYRRFQRILFSCLALLLVGVLALTGDTPAYSNPDGSITLGMPAFIKTVHAEENSPSAFPDGEAGIAAYLKVGQAIILTEAKVTNIFRTIEAQTGDYIIGTVPLPDYDDNFYPKLYIHKDGWFMAYYNESQPITKMFDHRHYDGSGKLPTTLESALRIAVLSAIEQEPPAASFYHFRYPNANKALLLADLADVNDFFEVKVPSSFQVYERSWSFVNKYVPYCCPYRTMKYQLNGQPISELVSDDRHLWVYAQGTFTVLQLPPDQLHKFEVIITDDRGVDAFASFGLVYKEQ